VMAMTENAFCKQKATKQVSLAATVSRRHATTMASRLSLASSWLARAICIPFDANPNPQLCRLGTSSTCIGRRNDQIARWTPSCIAEHLPRARQLDVTLLLVPYTLRWIVRSAVMRHLNRRPLLASLNPQRVRKIAWLVSKS